MDDHDQDQVAREVVREGLVRSRDFKADERASKCRLRTEQVDLGDRGKSRILDRQAAEHVRIQQSIVSVPSAGAIPR